MYLKKRNGITLIALVITIIVLLILAGVSIAMLTGENGILSQVQNSKAETEKASVIEQARLDIIGKQTEENGTTIYKEDIKEILDKYFEGVPDDFTLETELKTKPEYGDNQIKVSEIYNEELKERPPTAGEVLKVDRSGENAEDKSPYVKYYNGKNEEGLLCRVLYNDAEHGLQIITADNGVVPDVTLGYGDEKVTVNDFSYDGDARVDDNFKKAAASYNKALDTLNNKAKEYKDDKGIATDARCLGSEANIGKDGMFQLEDTSGMWSRTDQSFLTKYKWNEKFKDSEDTLNYFEVQDQLRPLGLNATSGDTWLAFRLVDSIPGSATFNVLVADTSGYWNRGSLCNVDLNGYARSYSLTNGFRPIFLLPSDVIISGGDGSKDNPYIIK